jgi:heptosyltransferase-3
MGALKRLEVFAKLTLALLASWLLARPWRRRQREARLQAPRRVLLVRIDNRVGEALLTTPLLTALREALPEVEVDLLVHARAVRVLAGHRDAHRVIGFDRRRLFLGALAPGIRALRAEGYDVVVDCANWAVPSVTSALVARLIGPHAAVLGPAVSPLAPLRTHAIAPRTDTVYEVAQRLNLLSPLVPNASAAMSFRPAQASTAITEVLARDPRPVAVVNPGGRLGWRRIPPEAFAAAARALATEGLRCIVTWGPGEEPLAREVAIAAGAEVAPPTTIDELAQLMRGARLTVCNNTGPMHLSVALGTPTLALFLKMDAKRWGHDRGPHRVIDLTPLVDSGADVPAFVAEASASYARNLAHEASTGVLR